MPAQGNALGKLNNQNKALKGRSNGVPPLQGFVCFWDCSQGVALGWYGSHLWCSDDAFCKSAGQALAVAFIHRLDGCYHCYHRAA